MVVAQKDNKTFKVTGTNIIIATGSKAKFLKGLSPKDNRMIMGYREALIPNRLPKNLLVIGSGAIGIELANFYNAMGSRVTILEVLDRILVNEDEEISHSRYRSYLQILEGEDENYRVDYWE